MNNTHELQIFMKNATWLRIYNKISKRQMASIMGVGNKTINKIEKGEIPARLKISAVFAVGKYFGIKVKDLFSRDLEQHRKL